jgi:predicted PurR-regulated permease PerM
MSGTSVPERIQNAGPADERPVVSASITFRSALRLAFALFIAYFAVQLARSVPETATRLLLGLVFAFAFDPIVTRLQRRLNTTRGVAVAVVGVSALVLFSILVAVVGPSAVRQAANSSRELPETVDTLTTLPLVGPVLDRLDAPERIREWVADAPSQLSDQSIADFVEAVIGGMATGATVIVVGVAVLLDGEALVRRLRQLVPRDRRQQADLVGRIFQRTIGAYFAGSLLVASLAATFVLIVGLTLNVPLTPIAALWVLIVSFIPQIGGFLAASVFSVLALGRGPGTALPGPLLGIHDVREPCAAARHRGKRREPFGAGHHAGRAHRRQRNGCAGGHSCHAGGGHSEGVVPRAEGARVHRADQTAVRFEQVVAQDQERLISVARTS